MAHEFIEHLIEDHDTQRSVGEQLRNAESAEDREELLTTMYEEVYPHMVGEEASIFDYMKSSEDKQAREEALEALEEHHAAKVIMGELMDLDPGSDVFKAKAAVLDEMNRHHMDKEEKLHFPKLESMLSVQELDDLYSRYEGAEEQAEAA